MSFLEYFLGSYWTPLEKVYFSAFNPPKMFLGTPHVSSFILQTTKLLILSYNFDSFRYLLKSNNS